MIDKEPFTCTTFLENVFRLCIEMGIPRSEAFSAQELLEPWLSSGLVEQPTPPFWWLEDGWVT
jgi:hypothetical protein